MRKRGFIVLLLAAAFVLPGGAASADIFYTTATSGYTGGTVGVITRDSAGNFSVRSNQAVGFGGDAWGYSFLDGNGDSALIVREFQHGGANDIVTVYDPGNWAAPLVNTTEWGRNLHGAASDGKYLYLALQDVYQYNQYGGSDISGQIARVPLEYPDYPDFIRQYEPDNYRDRKPQAVALAGDGYVYALSGAWEIYSFSHEQGEVTKFDSELNPIGTAAKVGKNPYSMAIYGGKAYVACQGGMLEAGLWGDIWEVNLDDMTSRQVVDLRNQGLSFAVGGASVSVARDGTAFVLAGGYDLNDGRKYKAKLWVTTADDLSNGSLGANVRDLPHDAGVSWLTCFDEEAGILWVGAGRSIEARGKDGALIRRFTPNELGGDAYSIALWIRNLAAEKPPVEPDPPDDKPADVEFVEAGTPKTVQEAAASTGIAADYFELVDSDGNGVAIKSDIGLALAKDALPASGDVKVHPVTVKEATVTREGNIATLAAPIEGSVLMASAPEDVCVLKILDVDDKKTDFFTFVDEASEYADGTFTLFGIGDGSGDRTVPKTILGTSEYLLVLFVKDNGKFDLDKRDCEIADPVEIVGGFAWGEQGGTASGAKPERGCAAGRGAVLPLIAALVCVLARKRVR